MALDHSTLGLENKFLEKKNQAEFFASTSLLNKIGILYFADWTGLDWTSKTRTSKTRTSKTRTGKTRTSKTRTGKTRTSKTRSGETRTSKTRTSKTRTGKTRTGKTQKKMLALLTQSSTIQRTSQVKIRGIITLNINV